MTGTSGVHPATPKEFFLLGEWGNLSDWPLLSSRGHVLRSDPPLSHEDSVTASPLQPPGPVLSLTLRTPMPL